LAASSTPSATRLASPSSSSPSTCAAPISPSSASAFLLPRSSSTLSTSSSSPTSRSTKFAAPRSGSSRGRWARAIKKTRWVLLKAPENLCDEEVEKLAILGRLNRPLYRAYLLKEALRDLYHAPLARAKTRLRAWLAWAARSRLPAFVKLGRTLRQYQHGVLAAIEHGLSNGRLEGLNNKIRLLSHRAYGFHSPEALLALVYLCCTGITLPLPSDRRPGFDPFMLAFDDRP